MQAVLYAIFLLFGTLVPLLIIAFCCYYMLADFFGAPFVPTSGKIVDDILKEAKLKRGQVFLELGSGDGRVVRSAVKNYGVHGVGVEMNIFLVYFSKILAKLAGLTNIEFRTGNFFKKNLSCADVVFMFLMPRTLEQLKQKFLKECKKGVLLISHGFAIPSFEKFLLKKVNRKPFPTYYYRI